VNSEGDAIYSRRVAELSKCQPEALCVCFVRFPRVCLSRARTYTYVFTRTYVYIHKMKGRFPTSVQPATCTEVKKRQRAKRPFPVTDRPDTTEIGCFCLVVGRGREKAKARVNSQGRNIGQDISRGNPSRNMSRVLETFLSVRVSPLLLLFPTSSLKFVATE